MDTNEGLYLIPEHMHGGILRYINKGIQPGGFLTALLSNDFMGAANRADQDNLKNLSGWAMFLYNHAPRGCYGSPEAVKDWKGLDNTQAT